MRVFNLEVLPVQKYHEIAKRLDVLEEKYRTRPSILFDRALQEDNAFVPNYASDLTARDMQQLSDISAVYRQIKTALKWELFRNSYAFKELRDNPDKQERETAQKFFKKANRNGQNILDVFKQVEDDLNTLDDGYFLLGFDYAYGQRLEIIGGMLLELVRLDPALMAIVCNKQLELGFTPEGKIANVCPVHRNNITDSDTCLQCGRKTYSAHFRAKNPQGEGHIYYLEREIIHISKFSPSLTYGYPPFLTVYQKVMIELYMDWFVKKSYEKGRPPNSWTFVKTSNQKALEKMIEFVEEKLKINPSYSIPIGVPTDSSGSFVEHVKLIDSMQEQQAVEFRQTIKREIGALFQVMPIFQGDTSTSGGLNNEGLQITVTNRAIETGQLPYNERVFPRLLEALGVKDWGVDLNPSEEKDEMAELQRQQLQLQNVQLALSLGYTVDRTENGEFNITGQAKPSLPTTGSLPAPSNPASEQRFSGEPESIRKAKPTKEMLRRAEETAKTLEEELKEMLDGLNFKVKRDETAVKISAGRIVDKFLKKIRNGTHDELKDTYAKARDEVEKELNINILWDKADANALEVLSSSAPLQQAYSGIGKRLSEKINGVIENAYSNPDGFSIGTMVKEMREVSDVEESQLRTIARTETTNVTNLARENSYSKAPGAEEFNYKWIGPDDERTTEYSKGVIRDIDGEGGAVPIERLKEIIRKNADQKVYRTDRPFTTHINQRHTFVRVV